VNGVIRTSTPPPGSPVAPAAPPPPGTAGASALREYERRKRNREERTRARHPHIGGLILALTGTPQSEAAFRQGGLGESEVAASLEKRTAGGPTVLLYDRRMPGGHGNIDLLAVAQTGVYVIDAKAHKGKVSITTPLIGRSRLLGRHQRHGRTAGGGTAAGVTARPALSRSVAAACCPAGCRAASCAADGRRAGASG
jgi:hypothetical protein